MAIRSRRQFADKYIVDKDNGEWFYGLDRDGLVNRRSPKINLWKGPYHNGRMCMEVIRWIK